MAENKETFKMLKAKLKCMELEDLACIGKGCDLNCDECDLNYEQGTRGEQKQSLKRAIDILENSQEVKHWISVKDKLPNSEERVLVFEKALGKIDNIHKDVITMNWITSSGEWVNMGDNYIVTHWMPLPEPPSTMDGEE